MEIKERIKQVRKSASLSQQELAKKLGMSFMTIRRWESGEISPRLDEIQKISTVLNTPMEYLIGLTQRNSVDVPIKLKDDTSYQKVIALADSSWDDNSHQPISVGFNGNHYEIYDGNTNQTIRIPNDPEGIRLVRDFTDRILNFRQPVVSNTINGDNNSGNQIGVVNN